MTRDEKKIQKNFIDTPSEKSCHHCSRPRVLNFCFLIYTLKILKVKFTPEFFLFLLLQMPITSREGKKS